METSSLPHSSSSTTTNISDIPTDVIIFKILLSMETKTLGRLRCVSRWWNTLISSSTFSLLHHRFRSLHHPPHQIHWDISKHDSGHHKYLFSSTDSAHPQLHNSWSFHHPTKHMSMVSESSCFGLICLYGFSGACIYNPTTRAVVVDLPSRNANSSCLPKFVLVLTPSTNQFKVLCFSTGQSYQNCNVLTLPEGLSEGSDIFEPFFASAEGAVYALSRCRERLFRFDTEREKWSEIKLPTVTKPTIISVEFGGRLCLVATTKEFCYEVWMLRDGDAWVKEWELNQNPNVVGGVMIPLHYHAKLGRILMRSIFGHLSWYWIKQGVYEDLYYLYECPGSWRYDIPYVETLASLETLRDIVDLKNLQNNLTARLRIYKLWVFGLPILVTFICIFFLFFSLLLCFISSGRVC